MEDQRYAVFRPGHVQVEGSSVRQVDDRHDRDRGMDGASTYSHNDAFRAFDRDRQPARSRGADHPDARELRMALVSLIGVPEAL